MLSFGGCHRVKHLIWHLMYLLETGISNVPIVLAYFGHPLQGLLMWAASNNYLLIPELAIVRICKIYTTTTKHANEITFAWLLHHIRLLCILEFILPSLFCIFVCLSLGFMVDIQLRPKLVIPLVNLMFLCFLQLKNERWTGSIRAFVENCQT